MIGSASLPSVDLDLPRPLRSNDALQLASAGGHSYELCEVVLAAEHWALNGGAKS